MPSVVTKDGMFRNTVRKPLMKPTAALATNADRDRQQDRHPRLVGEIHHERRQRVDHAGGEIDLSPRSSA